MIRINGHQVASLLLKHYRRGAQDRDPTLEEVELAKQVIGKLFNPQIQFLTIHHSSNHRSSLTTQH